MPYSWLLWWRPFTSLPIITTASKNFTKRPVLMKTGSSMRLSRLLFSGVASFLYAIRRLRQARREIRRRRLAEDEAGHLARHDALTGLPNRRSFLEELGSLELSIHPKSGAVFIIDLDRFKPINDLYGHRLGDEVLRVVAARLRAIVGEHVLIARLGGDEFGILMHFTGDDEGPSRVARRIVYDIAEPIKLAALSLQVSASVGIALYAREMDDCLLIKQDGSAVETVMRQADMAMYRAKTSGRGAYHFFEQEMDEQLQQRIQLEREINSAIQAGQIIPYYQPLIDLSTGEVLGFEILARWQHPTRGLLQPEILNSHRRRHRNDQRNDLFASASGNFRRLYLARPLHNLDQSVPPPIADKLLAPRILGILAEHSFPAHRLEIEITENALRKYRRDQSGA